MPQVDPDSFASLFAQYAPRVRAYARRHVDPSAVDDIVSETFLVAWRRRGDLPEEPLAWLLVVARNSLANRRRRFLRSAQPGLDPGKLDHLAALVPAVEDAVAERSLMLEALASLTAVEREAVLLVAWDGLSNRAAATVARCSEHAFTVRLHRARKRLARAIDGEPEHRESKDPSPVSLDLLLKEFP